MYTLIFELFGLETWGILLPYTDRFFNAPAVNAEKNRKFFSALGFPSCFMYCKNTEAKTLFPNAKNVKWETLQC